MIALPLFEPAVYETVNDPVAVVVEDDVATTFVGARGLPMTTGADSTVGPKPAVFFARTRNEYAVAFVSPAKLVVVAVAGSVFVNVVCATVPR